MACKNCKKARVMTVCEDCCSGCQASHDQEMDEIKEKLADATRTMDDLSEMVCDHAETDTEKLTESLREAITVEVKDAKAASPDVLKALEDFVRLYENYGVIANPGYASEPLIGPTINAARTAIAKAKIVEGG